MDDPAAPSPAPRSTGSIVRRVIGGVLTVAVVLAIFAFLVPQLTTASLSQVMDELTPAAVVTVLCVGLLHLACNWTSIVVSLPGVSLRKAGVANLSGAALSNSLPEGGAFGTALTYGIFHSWGFRVDSVTASLMSTGAWSQMVRYSLLAGGLLVLAIEGSSEAELVHALVIGVVVAIGIFLFLKVIDSETFAAKVGRLSDRVLTRLARLVHKGPSHATRWVLSLRSQLAGVAHDRGAKLTVTTLAGECSAVLVLVVSLRLMGIDHTEVGIALAVVAYGGASLASMVVPTPGGVGVAEAALLAILGTSVPEAQDAQLTAAVVLYRMATWLLPTLLGIPSYVWWRYRTSWRAPVDADPAAAAAGAAREVGRRRGPTDIT